MLSSVLKGYVRQTTSVPLPPIKYKGESEYPAFPTDTFTKYIAANNLKLGNNNFHIPNEHNTPKNKCSRTPHIFPQKFSFLL